MGNRTVVVLYNDRTDEWSKDPLLGEKIMIGMNDVYMTENHSHSQRADLDYGRVVECAHADVQTLAILDGYHYTPQARGFWVPGQKFENVQDNLLRAWASNMGYRLVRKPAKD